MVPSETPEDLAFENWLRSTLDQTPLPAELRVSRGAVASGGRQMLRRRKVARRGLIALATVAVVGVSVPLLNGTFTTGQGVAVGSCAATTVIDATGAQRLLTVLGSSPGKVDVRLFASADCEQDPSQRPVATDTVSIPAPGRVTAGRISGMPFYSVDGNVTKASVNGVAAIVVGSIGQQGSVIWPNQSSARSAGPQPLTITWTIGRSTYTQKVAAR